MLAYFVRFVPIDSIRGGKPVPPRVDRKHWFPQLKADIEKNGLMSPLFVLTKNDLPEQHIEAQWVRVGMNRLQAIRELGWKYAPCLIAGRIDDWKLPPESPELAVKWRAKDGRAKIPDGGSIQLEGIRLATLEECQQYLGDGRARLRTDGLTVSFGTPPDTFKYPRRANPYWPDSP